VPLEEMTHLRLVLFKVDFYHRLIQFEVLRSCDTIQFKMMTDLLLGIFIIFTLISPVETSTCLTFSCGKCFESSCKFVMAAGNQYMCVEKILLGMRIRKVFKASDCPRLQGILKFCLKKNKYCPRLQGILKFCLKKLN